MVISHLAKGADDGIRVFFSYHLAVYLLDADAVWRIISALFSAGKPWVVSYMLSGFWTEAHRHFASLKAGHSASGGDRLVLGIAAVCATRLLDYATGLECRPNRGLANSHQPARTALVGHHFH